MGMVHGEGHCPLQCLKNKGGFVGLHCTVFSRSTAAKEGGCGCCLQHSIIKCGATFQPYSPKIAKDRVSDGGCGRGCLPILTA